MSLPKSMMPMTRTMPGSISGRRLAASRILQLFSCLRIGSMMSVPVWRREWHWQCQGRGCFRWREDIILRLTEKFGVVRECEMTRRESEPTQLDERGGSAIRLLLPPTSELLLQALMVFCTIQRRRQMATSTEASGIASGAGDLCGSRFPVSAVKLSSRS